MSLQQREPVRARGGECGWGQGKVRRDARVFSLGYFIAQFGIKNPAIVIGPSFVGSNPTRCGKLLSLHVHRYSHIFRERNALVLGIYYTIWENLGSS